MHECEEMLRLKPLREGEDEGCSRADAAAGGGAPRDGGEEQEARRLISGSRRRKESREALRSGRRDENGRGLRLFAPTQLTAP